MKNKTCTLLTLAALAWTQPGCRSPKDTGAYPPLNTGVSNLESSAKFVALDKGVQESITCTGLQERTLADGRLEVMANVRNRENRRIQVQINCVFKDAQGFTVDETPFQNLMLTENSIQGVPFTCLNDKAKSYTVRVRQAR